MKFESQQLNDNSVALTSTSSNSISDPANNLKMLNTESEPSIIKSTMNGQQSEIQTSNSHFSLCEESSCDENDLEIQMQKLDKLLSSKSTDSEISDLEMEMQKFDELLSSKSTDSEKSDLDTEIERFYEVLNCESVNENTVCSRENSEVCPDEMMNKDKIANNVSISDDKVLVCDESDENEILILCCESDLDDSTYDATISELESIKSEIISDWEKDISEDASDTVAETNKDGTLIHCGESNLNHVNDDKQMLISDKVDIFNERSFIEEYLEVTDSDADSTLILCCESDLEDVVERKYMPICKAENIDISDEHIPVNDKCLVPISVSSDLIPHQPQADNSCCVKVQPMISDPPKQDSLRCNKVKLACTVSKSKEFEMALSTDRKVIANIEKPVKQEMDEFSEPPTVGSSDVNKSVTIETEPSKAGVKNLPTVVLTKSKEFETASLTCIKITEKIEKPVKQKMDEVSEPPIVKVNKVNKAVTMKTEPSKANPTTDFYEKEKHDIIDPRWQRVKELSTNEERYQQVKSCWGSTTVPDPDKNVSFHSYRRKQLKNSQSRPIRQHKRQASTKLSGGETKRSRPCTYMFDFKINSINKEREEEGQNLMQEMRAKLDTIEKQHYQKTVSLQNNYNFWNMNSLSYTLLENLKRAHIRKVACIKNEYHQKASLTCRKYQDGLESLNQVRNEVLQFYSFYKGLSASTVQDPTILSDSQLQELDDIENFYSQMNHYYK